MNTASITVAFVNPAAAGKKMGNIKLDDGSFYSVSPSMLSQFQPKGKYEVSYEEREYQGKMYRTVKTVKPLSAPTANGGGSGSGKYGSPDPATSENIFVCGVMNALAGAGQLDTAPTAIALMTNNLRMGWRQGMVPSPARATSAMAPKTEVVLDDMNDEIPF